MDNNTAVKTLAEFNKWRLGKGRKYSQPGFPFDPKDITAAIDHSLNVLKYIIPFGDFVDLTHASSQYLKLMKKAAASIKNANDRKFVNEMSVRLGGAVKRARKMCRNYEKKCL